MLRFLPQNPSALILHILLECYFISHSLLTSYPLFPRCQLVSLAIFSSTLCAFIWLSWLVTCVFAADPNLLRKKMKEKSRFTRCRPEGIRRIRIRRPRGWWIMCATYVINNSCPVNKYIVLDSVTHSLSLPSHAHLATTTGRRRAHIAYA